MEIFDPLLGILNILWVVFASVWWLIVPMALFEAFKFCWLFYVQTLYGRAISWTLLEVKIPKSIETTPKAMEQVFASMSAIFSFNISFYDKWWRGRFQNKLSFEIVGYSGGVYFFVWTPVGFRNLVEAAIYAQYPEAEIHPASDYTQVMPASLPNETYDLYGFDLVLLRDDAYPIKMYEDFEDKEDERRLDPIAGLTEAMSKLKEGETIWIQFIIEPDLEKEGWKKKGDQLVQKLIGAEAPKKASFAVDIFEALTSMFTFSDKPPIPEKREAPNKLSTMTQGQKDVVEEVEYKLSKIGFKTTIRFLFIDHRDRFSRANVAAVTGAFNQFNTMHLNAFKTYKPTMTKAKGFFKASRLLKKKQALYRAYKDREFSVKTCVLNIEELATVYHYPTMFVGAPKLQRIEAKKSEPPSNLPIG